LNGSLFLDFDPLAILNDFESINSFVSKSNTVLSFDDLNENTASKTVDRMELDFVRQAITNDMKALGCIVMELFVPKKFLSLGKCLFLYLVAKIK